ncbi:MAG: hypothetical protein IPJ16_00345 [Bacteroidales bacterium]|nr:hypothetical protein [Bacteroidales bacterium]
MVSILFNKEQNEVFDKQLGEFSDEIKVWRIINEFAPCIIILIPTFCLSFLPDDRVSFHNLFLNGSFSLLGINILFSMSIFLINSVRLKNVKIESQIIRLRIKLIVYLCLLLILGTIIYFIQIAFAIDTWPKIVFVVVTSFLILYFSMGIGKRIFLTRDELVGKSYGEDVIDNVNELKNSVDDLK